MLIVEAKKRADMKSIAITAITTGSTTDFVILDTTTNETPLKPTMLLVSGDWNILSVVYHDRIIQFPSGPNDKEYIGKSMRD